MNGNRGVGIQFGKTGSSDFVTGLPHVPSMKKELGGEIGNLDGGWIVESDGFHTSQAYIFGSLGRQQRCNSSESYNNIPISTPRPFRPTISTFDVLIRFMASCPRT